MAERSTSPDLGDLGGTERSGHPAATRERLLADAAARWGRLRDELEDQEQEVTLIAGDEVRRAAAGLKTVASSLSDDLVWVPVPQERVPYMADSVPRQAATSRYSASREAFLDAARRELGIHPPVTGAFPELRW
jgi:hypothetical protein